MLKKRTSTSFWDYLKEKLTKNIPNVSRICLHFSVNFYWTYERVPVIIDITMACDPSFKVFFLTMGWE